MREAAQRAASLSTAWALPPLACPQLPRATLTCSWRRAPERRMSVAAAALSRPHRAASPSPRCRALTALRRPHRPPLPAPPSPGPAPPAAPSCHPPHRPRIGAAVPAVRRQIARRRAQTRLPGPPLGPPPPPAVRRAVLCKRGGPRFSPSRGLCISWRHRPLSIPPTPSAPDPDHVRLVDHPSFTYSRGDQIWKGDIF